MKKYGSASDRISARLLGDSMMSDSGRYRGPLFARKKRPPYGLILLVILFMAATISLWELGKRYAPGVTKNVQANVRGLASEYFPDTPQEKKKK